MCAGETLTEFSARVDRHLKLNGESFTVVAQAGMRMRFAEIVPEAGDCEAAFRYHRELELLLQKRLGKAACFFKRAAVR